MRYGVARGVFTNEAGMGSSAIAHAASNVREPAEQGCGAFLRCLLPLCQSAPSQPW
ncbi:alanine:cation symporter family protein [Flavonifractor plautii]|nr:alanine:cation symporter family protein [Flavonifractor plautii]